MKPVVERLAKVASVPLIVKPNAGLPHVQDGKDGFMTFCPKNLPVP